MRLRALTDAPYAFESRLAYWQGEREEGWRSRLTDIPLNILAINGDMALGQVSGMAPDTDGRVELISMWVDPAARGQGVGDLLVAEVIAWARTIGSVAVGLAVVETNVRAVGLYRRMGFARSSESADEGEVRMALAIA